MFSHSPEFLSQHKSGIRRFFFAMGGYGEDEAKGRVRFQDEDEDEEAEGRVRFKDADEEEGHACVCVKDE